MSDSTLATMLAARQWLVGKLIPLPNGKTKKVPYYCDGTPRHGTLDTPEDIARLATHAEAAAAMSRIGAHVLGFALNQGWQGVDFDDIEEHYELVARKDTLPGYVERSPSGKGLHGIGFGASFLPLGSNASGVEAYASGRFFTVTMDLVRDAPLTDLASYVEGELTPLHAKGRKIKSPPVGTPRVHAPLPPRIPTGDANLDKLADDLVGALGFVDAEDRETWQAVGQALCTLGDTTGKPLFIGYSAKSERFPGGHGVDKIWPTLKGDRTGVGAIFKRAMAAGWKNPRTIDPAAVFNWAPVLPPGATRTPQIPAPPVIAAPLPPAERVSIADLISNPSPAQRFVIDKWLPFGTVTAVGGHGGTGKSGMMLNLGVHVAMALPFMGMAVEECKVLIYSAEDPAPTVRRRLRKHCQHLNVDPAALAMQMRVLDATANPVLFGGLTESSALEGLRAEIADFRPGLVIVDGASDCFAGNEIIRAEVRAFMRLINLLGAHLGAAIVLLMHVDKATAKNGSNGQGYSGSSAWSNSARSRWFLSPGPSDGLVQLEHQKANLSARADPLLMRWIDDGVLELVDHAAAVFDRAATEKFETEQVLAHIRAADAAGDPIPAAAAGSRPFWKVLAAQPGIPPLSPHRIRSIVEQLRAVGTVRVEQRRLPSRKSQEVFRV